MPTIQEINHFSVQQAADRLGFSASHIQALIRDGHLHGTRSDDTGEWMVESNSLRAFAGRRRVQS